MRYCTITTTYHRFARCKLNKNIRIIQIHKNENAFIKQRLQISIYVFNFVIYLVPGGGGGGHSLVSSVPMRDQKNDEKGYFFSRRAVRSADII